MKRIKSLFILVVFIFILFENIFATEGKFTIKIELLPRAEKEAKLEMEKIKEKKIKQLIKANIKYDSNTLKKMVKDEYIKRMTFEEFMGKITPESKKWLKKFFNNMKPDYISDFKNFYMKYKRNTFKEIKEFHDRNDKFKSQSKKARQISTRSSTILPSSPSPAPPLAPAPPPNEPSLSDIDGSKMIIKKYYNGQLRYIVTTPKQGIYLRGSYDNSDDTHFPDYENIYCDKCCGPAAGQSILEWFNVPVKKPDGTVLTETYDIQKRLANLMETEDGPDYTDPDDLARVLKSNKFRGSKGYCYIDGGGSFLDIHYMLSTGTPVILLLARDDWAHYVTVYGYNYDNDEYYLANRNANYSRKKLKVRWSFEETDWYIDVAFAVANIRPNTLFSYCPTGCERDWEYSITHDNISGYSDVNRYL